MVTYHYYIDQLRVYLENDGNPGNYGDCDFIYEVADGWGP